MKTSLISDKVSYTRGDGVLRVIVLGRIARWKETLLAIWLLAWIGVGVAMLVARADSDDRDLKLAIVVFMVFWAYYLYRVGRVWLYRRGGNELIELNAETLVHKRSFFTFGKAKTYFLENVKDLEITEIKLKSWAGFHEQGWWVLGTGRISFEYLGQRIAFASQLDEREAREVFNLVRRHLREFARNR